MIHYLERQESVLKALENDTKTSLRNALWIDLLSPSHAEEYTVEREIARKIPTREEMIEIELSSRLYKAKDTLYMTATMIAESESVAPKLEPITFVLTPNQLITIRYIDPQSFKLFTSRLEQLDITHQDATSLLIELLDTSIDRLADILEHLGGHLENHSKVIFQQTDAKVKLDHQQIMNKIGASADLNTKARESLVTFNRLISFFGQALDPKTNSEANLRLTSLSKDISSLSDHANFLSSKINFLLDATLGMVNIEQNNIIKLFSVAAVIFLPPTLVASIYGMNFNFMPELSWKHGYIFSLGMILLAAWLPYKYFKYKKWL